MTRLPSRGAEIRNVAARLDLLMDELRASVDALTALLPKDTPPETPEAERLVTPHG